jgi:hypothetical protein
LSGRSLVQYISGRTQPMHQPVSGNPYVSSAYCQRITDERWIVVVYHEFQPTSRSYLNPPIYLTHIKYSEGIE